LHNSKLYISYARHGLRLPLLAQRLSNRLTMLSTFEVTVKLSASVAHQFEPMGVPIHHLIMVTLTDLMPTLDRVADSVEILVQILLKWAHTATFGL
jgi:hypothetical protein